MTKKELQKLVEELVQAQIRTETQLAKTDAQLAKTDEKLNKLAEMYGGVSNSQGKVAEEFFYNSLKHKPEINGIHFDLILKNVTSSKGNIEEEYDIILVNGQSVYVIEVKYKLHQKDIERFFERKLPNFPVLFPIYQDRKIRVGFASFSIEDELVSLAKEKDFILLQRRGDVSETLAA
jgi:hypothetical protein